MAEYIEREKVLKFIQDGLNYPDRASAKAFGYDGVEIMSEVYHMPAADVAPVVRGRWEKKNTPMFDPREEWFACSECCECAEKQFLSNYCPNCGAKMDLPPSESTGLEGSEDK